MPVDLSRVRIDWRTAEPLCHSFVDARVIDLSRIALLTPVAGERNIFSLADSIGRRDVPPTHGCQPE